MDGSQLAQGSILMDFESVINDVEKSHLLFFSLMRLDGNAEIIIFWMGVLNVLYSKEHVYAYLNQHEEGIKAIAGKDAPAKIALSVMNMDTLPQSREDLNPRLGIDSIILKLMLAVMIADPDGLKKVGVVFKETSPEESWS